MVVWSITRVDGDRWASMLLRGFARTGKLVNSDRGETRML